jgi:hypothetical protein
VQAAATTFECQGYDKEIMTRRRLVAPAIAPTVCHHQHRAARAVTRLAAFDELTAQQRDATSLRTKIAPQIGDVARDINSKMQDEGESLLMMALGLNVLLVPWA